AAPSPALADVASPPLVTLLAGDTALPTPQWTNSSCRLLEPLALPFLVGAGYSGQAASKVTAGSTRRMARRARLRRGARAASIMVAMSSRRSSSRLMPASAARCLTISGVILVSSAMGMPPSSAAHRKCRASLARGKALVLACDLVLFCPTRLDGG